MNASIILPSRPEHITFDTVCDHWLVVFFKLTSYLYPADFNMDLKTALLFLTDGTFYTVRLCDYYRCFEWLLMHALPTPSPSAQRLQQQQLTVFGWTILSWRSFFNPKTVKVQHFYVGLQSSVKIRPKYKLWSLTLKLAVGVHEPWTNLSAAGCKQCCAYE